MSRIVALNFSHHKDLGISRDRTHEAVINEHLLPVVANEFIRASACFPLVISKNQETGEFTFSAMMGFEQGENLFVRSGQWDAPYLPLQVQRQPFFVGEDNGEKLICFDSESRLISQSGGDRLFNETEEPSDYLKNIQRILSELVAGDQDNQLFLQQLLDLDLLTPLVLDIVFDTGEEQSIRGAYCVDEERMSALSDEQVLSLHRSGYLRLIHLMQGSMEHFQSMVKRKNGLLANAKNWFEAS